MVRPVTPADFEAVRSIYNFYVNETTATFDTEEITANVFELKMRSNAGYPCLVFIKNEKVIGFISTAAWKAKMAYEKTVEISIYINSSHCGQGYGKKLFEQIIPLLKQQDVHSVISAIIMPNERSIALHVGVGFKKVGQFTEAGQKFGKWFDVSYWQLIL